MPPEPLPWDRRDFRKHERSGSDQRIGGGGFGSGGPHRWREQQHHHPHAPPSHAPPYHHHQQQQRWYSDFRSSRPLPPGHGKQGNWHMYPDDVGHGYMPFGSRYNDRNLDDENCRPFGGSRGDGRYFRNSRENRGSISQKGWKSPSWEPAASPSGPTKPTTEVNNLRSIENTQSCNNNSSSNKNTHASHPPPDSVNLPDQSQSVVKEKNDKNGVLADEPASEGQKSEKENCLGSIDWKPLKWTRSGSLSSRGSGLSHSSSPKSVGVDSSETVVELQPKNVTPVQSPCADAAACVVANVPAQSDETGSKKKKPRLGWGEGLAKYEKKKVEGPEDCAAKNEVVQSNMENLHSHAVNLPDKSPGVESLPDCASPATPSSVGCSFSPGIEGKEFVKEANVDQDTTNLSCSPSTLSQANYDGPTFNLENLELASVANLSPLIHELLQSDDPSSTDTGYERITSMNKLLIWKVDVLKALEITETEIDSLETELKSLSAEPKSGCPHSKSAIRPAPLHVFSSGETNVDNEPVAMEHERVVSKDEDIDSPGSATSKFVEEIFCSDAVEFVEGSKNRDVENSSDSNEKCSKNGLIQEENSGCVGNHILSCGDLASVSSAQCDGDYVYDLIITSNKDYANQRVEELSKLLPAKHCLFDITCSVSSLQRDSAVVKEKFLRRKRFLQFKEKALTLKFKVFQHFWKKGRIISLRKLRVKTQKKLDPNRNGLKKSRSASRSRFSSYVGSPQTVPADEVIEFVNQLLSESAFKPYRNTLKMPALILDKETKMSRFISRNGLVEDPHAVEKERSMINPWTPEEKEIFIDKLAELGKDFGKIASFLDHKTIADCIEFYYKNHKSDTFEKARKNPDSMKQRKSQSTTYLVASGKRWNREVNAASLDMLGAASEIAANVNNSIEIQQKCTSRIFPGASSSHSNERETVAADVLAGICGSLSSEAMSSCITTSVDHIKRPLTPEVSQNGEDECSDESCGELDPTDWTDEEKSLFIHAVSSYGKDFAMISQCVRTKSMDQCKVFFSKARKCLGLDLIQSGVGNLSGDFNGGGGSDVEDVCAAGMGETSSAICINGSDCKMEEDPPHPEMKSNHESDPTAAIDPVLKNSLSDRGGADDNPVTDLNVDSKESNGAESIGTVEAEKKGQCEEGSQRQDLLLCAENLDDNNNNNPVEDRDANSSEVSDISSSVSEMKSCGPQLSTQADQMSSSAVKSCLSSLQQNGQLPSVKKSSTLFSVPIKYQRNPNHNGLLAPSQKIGSQQHRVDQSSSDSVESSQILRGYPVSVHTVKDINGNVNCKKPFQNDPSDQHREFFLEKCNGSRKQSNIVEASSAVDDNKPSRNGDVKLFGKILTSSQQQKPNSCTQTNGNNSWDQDQKVNFDSVQSKIDSNNYVVSENVPVRSFGFWDGNRIQAGFPTIPDSALLLAKYPAAFSNCVIPTAKRDQPHGVSVFPSSSRGLADYQVLRNREVQPFTIDMQRRNGFDLASGVPQPARGVLGINGQDSSGVSDPVAALKMHFAKAEQMSMMQGNVMKDDHRWRSNGDLGR